MHRLLLASGLTLLALVSVLAAPAGTRSPTPPVQTVVVPSGSEPCGIAARDGRLWVGV